MHTHVYILNVSICTYRISIYECMHISTYVSDVCVCVCAGDRFQGTHDPWLTSPSAHPTTPDRDPKLKHTHTHTCTFPPSEASIREPAVQAPNHVSYA
jgi:hypothetical protein